MKEGLLIGPTDFRFLMIWKRLFRIKVSPGKKYNCKGVSKKHNDLYVKCYKDVLDIFYKTAIVD